MIKSRKHNTSPHMIKSVFKSVFKGYLDIGFARVINLKGETISTEYSKKHC